MNITEFIKPELVVVAVVCYFIGIGLKNTALVKDKYIPLILGAVGVVICLVYVGATSSFADMQSVLMAVFVAITQGILVAGASTYVNQVAKQLKKTEE